MMTHIYEHQSRRSAEYGAKALLIQQGWEVARVTERDGAHPALFHLIAWDVKQGFLFIRIGSPRMKRSAVLTEIERLSAHVRTGKYPGKVQFWIEKEKHWNRYQILPGGAVWLSGEKND
jgi:hypothetical protein